MEFLWFICGVLIGLFFGSMLGYNDGREKLQQEMDRRSREFWETQAIYESVYPMPQILSAARAMKNDHELLTKVQETIRAHRWGLE